MRLRAAEPLTCAGGVRVEGNSGAGCSGAAAVMSAEEPSTASSCSAVPGVFPFFAAFCTVPHEARENDLIADRGLPPQNQKEEHPCTGIRWSAHKEKQSDPTPISVLLFC